MDIIFDINNFDLDDLREEYKKLLNLYQNISKQREDDQQQIYELKSNLKLSKATEEHLLQEIELLTGSQNNDLEESNKKLSQELDEYKKKITDLEEWNESLERKIESLETENSELQDQLHDLAISLKKIPKTKEIPDEVMEKIQKLEAENFDLFGKLNEFQDMQQKSILAMAEKERLIEVLKEEIQCHEENLNAKRLELDEKTTLLESLQERIIELNSEISSIKIQPENENRKGNSLFAEVDDQRQAMKKKLLAHRQSYLEMKKIFNESQTEIRRLKRENSAMQSEIQACSYIFLNSKKFYEDKLLDKISNLSKENNELETKLNVTESRLLSLADKNEITWLDSMMTFCKNETKELKAQLKHIRLQKEFIEKSYRDSQQELAKWRLEALTSRCIITDRETLLQENSIKFKNNFKFSMEFNEEDVLNYSPQISCVQQNQASTLSTKTPNDESICKNASSIGKDKGVAVSFDKSIIPEASELPENTKYNIKENESIVCSSIISPKIENIDEEFGKLTKFEIFPTTCNLIEISNIKKEVITSCNSWDANNEELIVKNSPNSFQIFEDSNCKMECKSFENAPKPAVGKSESYSIQPIVEDKENQQPTVNHIAKKASIKKESCILPEKESIKSVHFANNLNSKNENAFKGSNDVTTNVIAKKTKSNITVKKIIIKSKDVKKE